MRLKYTALFAGLLLVAACETAPTTSGTSTSTTGATGPSTSTTTTTSAYRPGSQEELEATIGSRVFFDFDKSTIRSDARQTIERWASWMKQHPSVSVTIEGHADERGTREYNLALGERRAVAARDALVALGIASNRIGTISYGKERPEVMGSNEQAWARNRRDYLRVN